MRCTNHNVCLNIAFSGFYTHNPVFLHQKIGHHLTFAKINTKVLHLLQEASIIPVIAPIGVGEDGTTYNINADTVAGAVAAAMGAARLLMLTDIEGVLDSEKRLITDMTAREAREAIAKKVITGGMIPKIETCLNAVENSVEAAVILDGRVHHAVLLEIFTESGVGTLISAPGRETG